MDEEKLEVSLREATNGWIVELNKFVETIEYIFNRHNTAISLLRKVMKGELDVFSQEELDE